MSHKRRLIYWIADNLKDSPCFSIRERTRKAVNVELTTGGYGLVDFGKPRKVVIEYTDAFDLMRQLLSEDGAEHTESIDG